MLRWKRSPDDLEPLYVRKELLSSQGEKKTFRIVSLDPPNKEYVVSEEMGSPFLPKGRDMPPEDMLSL